MSAVRIYSPWEHIGTDYPEWVVRHRPLHGAREALCWRRRVILIELEQSTAASRCSLAHAIGHLDLNHEAGETTARFRDREERAADTLAARRLLPLERLIDTARWANSRAEALDLLWVDDATLTARLAQPTPSGTCGDPASPAGPRQ